MHAHRSAGHPVPSFHPPGQPSWSDKVRGLGVSDALQLQLEPGQLPWFLDELEELRAAHEQGVSEAAAVRAATTGTERARRAVEDSEHHRHELTLVRGVRDRVSRQPQGGAIVCGPAPMVSSLVRGAARAATEALAEIVDDQPGVCDAAAGRRLSAVAAAARAWVDTLVALQQLEWFTFEAQPPTGIVERPN